MTKIIADACCNHLNNDEIIKTMIDKASGVDYIKFQAFTADQLNPKYPNYKDNKEYYQSMELTYSQFKDIYKHCKFKNITPLITIFDKVLINMFVEIGYKDVKIASPDMSNHDLIDKCVDSFPNVIISTGMHSNREIKQTMNRYKNAKFLYCISKYPLDYNDIDFDKMQLFDGFSDHTKTTEASKKAIELGVEFIERHYTLGKDLPGRDHHISSIPDEFKELVDYRNYIKNVNNYKTRWR